MVMWLLETESKLNEFLGEFNLWVKQASVK